MGKAGRQVVGWLGQEWGEDRGMVEMGQEVGENNSR